jgi:hypothetical protein
MILIITTSVDRTTDLLIGRLPLPEVFRFNADLLAEYEMEFTPNSFRLRDPVGRELTAEGVTACYFRKLNFPTTPNMPAGGSVAAWLQKTQSTYAHELYDWFRGTDKMVLEIGAHYSPGKITQMNMASAFFPVPPWFAGVSPRIGELPFARNCVSKNLSNTFIQDFKGHLIAKVDAGQLDPAYPWFLQEMTHSRADVTVVYVNGRCFAYECPRKEGDVDCRTYEKYDKWQSVPLSDGNEKAIVAFMQKARLNFGRLDFLAGDGERLFFLEVNTNGQWGWLDLKGENGLFDAIAEEILAVHRRNA